MSVDRLAVGHALVNFRITLFHEALGRGECLKAKTCIKPMRVTRNEHPTPQILQVGMRHNRRHDGFADALATMTGIHEHVRYICECGAIRNHPAEANSRTMLDGAEAE